MACCELGLDTKDTEDESNNGQSSINDCRITDNSHAMVDHMLEVQQQLYHQDQSTIDNDDNSINVTSNNNNNNSNSLLVIVERQENEIKALKSQLTVAHDELAGAHNELLRLDQQKIETEKQLEQVLGNVQRNEQQRNKQQVDDLDKIKKLYGRDKELLERKLRETEAVLRDTSDRCQIITNQLESSHTNVDHLKVEVATLSDRLSQGELLFLLFVGGRIFFFFK